MEDAAFGQADRLQIVRRAATRGAHHGIAEKHCAARAAARSAQAPTNGNSRCQCPPSRLRGENAVAALYFAKVGHGMMSDCFRFEPCWERDDTALPVTSVGKFAAADPTSNATGKQFNQYRAEACFYADIAPALPARVPHAWYSQASDNGDLTLLMEDLRDARSIDQATEGCSLEDAAAALREFAKLHGHHWADPSLDRIGWLKQQDQKAVRMAVAVPDALAGFVHRYADMLEPEYLLLVARVPPGCLAMAIDCSAPRTLQHGDFRPDNLLLHANGVAGSVHILDWARSTLASLLMAFSFFLGQALDADQLRDHRQDLIRTYYGALSAYDIGGYSWEDWSLKQ